MQKATWAAAFWRVGRDFRAALWAKSGCADHWGRVARALLSFLLRKMLPEVRLGPQQINREAHPGDKQARLRRERRRRDCRNALHKDRARIVFDIVTPHGCRH
jgi:hypothetical protein